MKKVGKIVGISIGVIVALGIVLNLWLGWSGDPAPITSAANKFVPQAEWKLTEEVILPPRNFCLTQICPSVARKWEVGLIKSKKDFENTASQSGLKLSTYDRCLETYDSNELLQYCSGIVDSEKYHYHLQYTNSSSGEPALSLTVTEKK